MPEDIDLIRSDVSKLDNKLDRIQECIQSFMREQAGAVATLQNESATQAKNISELWHQFNETKAKQTELYTAIEAVEAKAKGMAKMWALLGGAAALLVALFQIFGRPA